MGHRHVRRLIAVGDNKSGVSKFIIVGYNSESGVSVFTIVGYNNGSGVSVFTIVRDNVGGLCPLLFDVEIEQPRVADEAF